MKRLILFILAIACFGLAAKLLFVPALMDTSDAEATRVRIAVPQGATADDVSKLLKEKGILDGALAYRLFSLLSQNAQRPKAGDYDLTAGMSFRSIANMLALGQARDEISVKLLEGWTMQDVTKAVQEFGVDVRPSDFLADRVAGDYSFLKGLAPNTTLEGYLFPDTYRVWKDQLPDGLLHKQLSEFAEKTAGFEAMAKAKGRTLHEVVILASIIQSEVSNAEDFATVSGIFANRLEKGMPLQSDATLNYVLRTGRTSLTFAELDNDSPYNTYKHKGLPPGPIGNPGKAALEAALNPAKTDYLYFLTDKQGKTYFAKTLEGHNQNRIKAGL